MNESSEVWKILCDESPYEPTQILIRRYGLLPLTLVGLVTNTLNILVFTRRGTMPPSLVSRQGSRGDV